MVTGGGGLRDPLWRDPGFDLVLFFFYLPAERGIRRATGGKRIRPAARLHNIFAYPNEKKKTST